MTVKEYQQKLMKQLAELKELNTPLQVAAATTHATMVERIFQEGKNADGKEIGKYNTTSEIYLNPNKAVRKQGVKIQGKTGETVFKNGKKHKTAYFKSYSEYRGKTGRQTKYVDLVLSGDLQKDLSNKGLPVRLTQHKYVSRVSREINADKISGNEDRYNAKIFALTISEKKEFEKIALQELINILS